MRQKWDSFSYDIRPAFARWRMVQVDGSHTDHRKMQMYQIALTHNLTEYCDTNAITGLGSNSISSLDRDEIW